MLANLDGGLGESGHTGSWWIAAGTLVTGIIGGLSVAYLRVFDAMAKHSAEVERSTIAEYRRLVDDHEKRILKLEESNDDKDKLILQLNGKIQVHMRDKFHMRNWIRQHEEAMTAASIPFNPFSLTDTANGDPPA